jgi:tRNA threonylcarbamoyl adenosine modification protein YeaZ
MTLVLAIENSNPSSAQDGAIAVAVGRLDGDGAGGIGGGGGDMLAAAELRPVSRHDDGLMPAVARACDEAGVGPREIGLVAVSAGPGGFTAVRIGVTTAKAIAQAVGARVACVPTAWAVRASAGVGVGSGGGARDGAGPDERVAVALAWKRSTVWRETFERGAFRAGAAGLVSVEELREELVGAGRSGEACAMIADERFVRALTDGWSMPSGVRALAPTFDARAVLGCAALVEHVEPARAAPIYPREPEAVSKWRELHGHR